MSEHLSNELLNPKNGGTHFLDLVLVLTLNRKLVIGLPLASAALALGCTFLIAPTFTSTARIMPPQQQQSSGVAAMLGQLGSIAGAAGGLSGIKSPNDLYIGLLESRTIADNLIARFKLQQRYDEKTMDATRKELAKNTLVVNGKKDGLITVSADDEDPVFAANLANAYVDELTRLTQTMALTEASQRRMFFEKQLKDAKEQLAGAEIALRTTQERTGMIQPNGQVQAIIANVAQLQGAIAAKEVQLNSMRTFAAAGNPDLLRTQEELRSMQGQLSRLEKNQPSSDGSFMVPTGKIPQVSVDYVRSVRDVKYYETIFELLAKQFELAKIDEAKDASLIQVLDKGVPADRKSKPKRSLYTLLGGIVGAIAGLAIAFLRTTYRNSRANPESDVRWAAVTRAWRKEHAGPRRGN